MDPTVLSRIWRFGGCRCMRFVIRIRLLQASELRVHFLGFEFRQLRV